MKKRYRILRAGAVLVSVLIAVLAGIIWWVQPLKDIGIADDFSDVDLETVSAFAERSNAAYHEEKIFRHEYGEQVEAGEFPNTGLRVYIDSNALGKGQWVIIRGTANEANILGDLDFVGRDEHELGINVHAGFDRSLQDCLPWILERLDPKRPVWVTGHSLGGAVAVLLVATLDHRGFADVSAITFGQPKFTDAHGAAKLSHLKILRIVHDEDPVPMLPPTMVEGKVISTYAHLGPEIIVRSSGHFSYLHAHDADRMNIGNIWAEIENIQPFYHDMVKGYLPALKLAMKSAPKKVLVIKPPAP
ncbi:MAG: lipase family protein [Luteolibacter sp.]|uniref:lipase family protein n=1 Tax=Luteolibacter sp. TaxID=1962973 RepID=UPI0032655C7C